MTVGYQGEPFSYSHRVATKLFGEQAELVGFSSFQATFDALDAGLVTKLVMPIENSTTGSILPVLDRLLIHEVHITGERLQEIQHALLAHPGATLETIRTVHSHPQALSQAEGAITRHGWDAQPEHDTAGAVRLVAERGDPAEACLAHPDSAAAHGLVVLLHNVVDRAHNTTRFVVLEPGHQRIIPPNADKTSVAFETAHTPGALAMALVELGLRGANLSRIESRPTETAWRYRMFVDVNHQPGPAGYDAIFRPLPPSISNVQFLGTYPAAPPEPEPTLGAV